MYFIYKMIDFLSSEDENRIKFQNQLSGQKLFLIELFIRYNIIMGKLELWNFQNYNLAEQLNMKNLYPSCILNKVLWAPSWCILISDRFLFLAVIYEN